MISDFYRRSKDPDEVVEYDWDFAAELPDGATVSAHSATATGVTVDSTRVDGARVIAKLSGGTHGENAEITFQVTTDTPETFERTALLPIRNH